MCLLFITYFSHIMSQKDQTNPQDDAAKSDQIDQGEEQQLASTESSDQELLVAQQKIEELTNGYARAMADLENYRKRTELEKGEFAKYANAGLLNALLPCLDNFKKAAAFIPEDHKDQEWKKGLDQAIKLFDETLKKQGVEEIKTVGEKMDHNLHEALMQGEGEEGIIIEEFEKGYTLRGQVVRHAKVKVGKG